MRSLYIHAYALQLTAAYTGLAAACTTAGTMQACLPCHAACAAGVKDVSQAMQAPGLVLQVLHTKHTQDFRTPPFNHQSCTRLFSALLQLGAAAANHSSAGC
jgi:hypothetical protein